MYDEVHALSRSDGIGFRFREVDALLQARDVRGEIGRWLPRCERSIRRDLEFLERDRRVVVSFRRDNAGGFARAIRVVQEDHEPEREVVVRDQVRPVHVEVRTIMDLDVASGILEPYDHRSGGDAKAEVAAHTLYLGNGFPELVEAV